MGALAVVTGMIFIAACLQDVFEAVLLPRRTDREWRFTVFFYGLGWRAWSEVARRVKVGRKRESLIAIFGPLSMVLLFSLWGLSLVLGFGLIQWALPAHPLPILPLSRQFDLSADAFFTLGIENLTSRSQASLVLIFIEAGTGFGFIALMVSYLPVLYTHFAQRDARLVQLDARAGTPASAGTLLLRYARLGTVSELAAWLSDSERWSADLVESHSAYPMLAFYRSQHANQSWLGTLAVIMDATTFLLTSGPDEVLMPASGAFLAARRVLEEICISLDVQPAMNQSLDRFSETALEEIAARLNESGWQIVLPLRRQTASPLVESYEPMLRALSDYLLLPLPRLVIEQEEMLRRTEHDERSTLIERLTTKRQS